MKGIIERGADAVEKSDPKREDKKNKENNIGQKMGQHTHELTVWGLKVKEKKIEGII